MPQVMIANVKCPNCQRPFQARVEQVLDAGKDPSARSRVLNGLVNKAVCPHCKSPSTLVLPYMYHDADKELALIQMPLQAGRSELERQQAIGRITQSVLNSLPAEKRKGYLLQPQVFLTHENMVNKILEAEGVTSEMIEEQKAKAALLQRMIGASSEDVLEAMAKENDASIDPVFFQMLERTIQVTQAAGDTLGAQKVQLLRNKLMDLSSEGRVIRERSKVVDALRDAPTREKLLELLIQSRERETRELLVMVGQQLVDYPFFQMITAKIEAASDDEKHQLVALRSEILEIRDEITQRARAVMEARSELLRELLVSKDPVALAQRRFSELDRAFLGVLSSNLEEARTSGSEDAVKALQAIWALTVRLMEEAMPPQIKLFRQLMSIDNDEEMEKALEENRDLVTEELAELIERAHAEMVKSDQEEEAGRAATVLAKVKQLVEKERAPSILIP